MKKMLGVHRWAHDASWRDALTNLYTKPTVNIEGISGGYTGTGGKTLLPHRAVAKLDLRLVPDMTYDGALAALKAHLAKRGFGDIEVVPSGGYDPTSTDIKSELIQRQIKTYRSYGIEATISPRNVGSYPGWVFTGAPLNLPAGHFGLGHGEGQHAPDEYYLIESTNPKMGGIDDATRSFVDYLYELSR
jgi:acetylornithine deacetylase/succinyl-diaminopimelate desuccinylase-like protein